MRTVDVIPLFTLIKQAVHLTSYCFKYDFASFNSYISKL